MSGGIKTVLLIGASGTLGKPVLQEFLSSPYEVSVLTRETSKSTFPSSVKVLRSGYTFESLVSAFEGQDAVVCLVGSPRVADEQRIIDAAVKANVKRFLPSEFGSDTSNDVVRERCPIFVEKREIIEYLQTKEKDGLTWTGLINGPFFDWGLANEAFLGFETKTKTATIWDGGDVSFSATNLSTVGKAIISILSNADRLAATENKYVYIASHLTTQNEILSVIEKTTGDKWTETHVKADDVGPKARTALKSGDRSKILDLVRLAFLAPDEQGDFKKRYGGISNELLDLPDEDLAESVNIALG